MSPYIFEKMKMKKGFFFFRAHFFFYFLILTNLFDVRSQRCVSAVFWAVLTALLYMHYTYHEHRPTGMPVLYMHIPTMSIDLHGGACTIYHEGHLAEHCGHHNVRRQRAAGEELGVAD